MTTSLSGGCLCGAIRYTIGQPVTELRACHCTNCQKASGAGGSVNAVIPTSAFTLLQGKPRRHTGKADSGRTLHRYFCGDCGSPIYSQREINPERMVVRAGTFDNPPTMTIVTNIWTRSARPWSWIDPASERVAGSPD